MNDERPRPTEDRSSEGERRDGPEADLPAERDPGAETSLQKPTGGAVEWVEPERITDLAATQPAGLISKLRVGNLRSRKELEAVEVVLDTQLARLRHQGEAVARESKAYWDAKSVEVASSIKTYVQARLRAMENERMASRMDSLQEAYELYASKAREVLEGAMPDSMKESLITRLGKTLEETLRRIETDAVAEKHDLSD